MTTLYDPPRHAPLEAAYDVGWGSDSINRATQDREQAALAHVAHAVETHVAVVIEGLVDSADDHVSKEEILDALGRLARELRTARHEQTGEIPKVGP